MSDLIRREDVFKAIVGLTTHKTVDDIEIFCEDSVAGSEGWLGGIRDALREVEYIPSAEPEERTAKVIKHKYWLWVSLNVVGEQTIGYEWICENCKKKVIDGDDYCSHCGAKLIWGEEE